MTILRIHIAVLLLLCSLAGGAQVRPDQFPLKTTHTGTDFEIYSQYGGVNEKTTPFYLKYYYTPNVDSAWQAFTFTDSIGIADSLRMMFLKDNRGRVFYVDADGDALLLKDTAQAVGNVYALATLADTSTVASPVEGDIAVIGSDTLLFYETYWLMFAGGAGGIYGGSGTVPASTWVEQLGSLIFDIDSLGSFTVGDIDEKSTGAYISISNTGGNDGAIVMKSGSGKGTTDATIELNNYYLPGTTPSGESLPAGDYFWIVSEGGVRKGQDSTGWIHIDSLLNGYTTGSGTPGTLPIWTGTETLGNSSLTEASGVLSSSLTGALKLPAGTDAQDPVWAAGMLRYNTTANGLQGYDGAAERYLPWADADNWTSGYVPYMNSAGSALTTSANLVMSGGNELHIGGVTDAGAYELQVKGEVYIIDDNEQLLFSTGSQYMNISATAAYTSSLGLNVTSNKRTRISTTVSGWDTYIETPPISNTEGYIQVGNSVYGQQSLSVRGGGGAVSRFSSGNEALIVAYAGNSTTTQYSSWLLIKGSDTDANWGSGNAAGGDVVIVGGASNDSGLPGDVVLAFTGTGKRGSVGVGAAPTSDFDVNGKVRIRTLPDSLYTYEVRADANGRLARQPGAVAGTISTSTDGSGDITVAHGMGVTPTVVDIQFTGTSGSATPYVYVVLIDGTDATNFTIRVFDMTGAAVTSTAVTATWHCKT